MKVFGYVRINNLRTKPKNLSLKKQEKTITDWADEEGWEVEEIIKDVENTSVSLELPGIQRLCDLADSGEMDILIIPRLDRLTRSIRTLNQMIETLCIKNDVRLISVEENLDTSGDRGLLALDLVRIIARWDAKMISDRTKELIEKKRKVGESVGHAPYGFVYKEKKLVPFDNELKVVKIIRDKRNRENLSYHKIARFLNDSKIPSKRGGQWYAETVKTIYENKIYNDQDLDELAS